MVKGLGVDMEEVLEFKKLVKDKKFIESIFTANEIEYCTKKHEPYISYTGIFCAKEALKKAIGRNISMLDIEVRHDKRGAPYMVIKPNKIKGISCSITHTDDYAVAFVVID